MSPVSDGALQVPSGIAVPEVSRVYVRGRDGHVEALDARTGVLQGRSDFAAEPLAANGSDLLAVRLPTGADAGEVVMARTKDDEFEVLWRAPLLDEKTHRAMASVLEDVRLAAAFVDDLVEVTADVSTRYRGGAAASDKLIDRANVDRRLTLRLRRDNGETVERETIEHAAGQGETTQRALAGSRTTQSGGADAKAAAARSIQRGKAPNQWTIVDAPSGDSVADVELDDGTEEAAIVGDQVMYRVAETDADGTSRRRYLRSRNVETGGTNWSRLIEETELIPQPPLPQ